MAAIAPRTVDGWSEHEFSVFRLVTTLKPPFYIRRIGGYYSDKESECFSDGDEYYVHQRLRIKSVVAAVEIKRQSKFIKQKLHIPLDYDGRFSVVGARSRQTDDEGSTLRELLSDSSNSLPLEVRLITRKVHGAIFLSKLQGSDSTLTLVDQTTDEYFLASSSKDTCHGGVAFIFSTESSLTFYVKNATHPEDPKRHFEVKDLNYDNFIYNVGSPLVITRNITDLYASRRRPPKMSVLLGGSSTGAVPSQRAYPGAAKLGRTPPPIPVKLAPVPPRKMQHSAFSSVTKTSGDLDTTQSAFTHRPVNEQTWRRADQPKTPPPKPLPKRQQQPVKGTAQETTTFCYEVSEPIGMAQSKSEHTTSLHSPTPPSASGHSVATQPCYEVTEPIETTQSKPITSLHSPTSPAPDGHSTSEPFRREGRHSRVTKEPVILTDSIRNKPPSPLTQTYPPKPKLRPEIPPKIAPRNTRQETSPHTNIDAQTDKPPDTPPRTGRKAMYQPQRTSEDSDDPEEPYNRQLDKDNKNQDAVSLPPPPIIPHGAHSLKSPDNQHQPNGNDDYYLTPMGKPNHNSSESDYDAGDYEELDSEDSAEDYEPISDLDLSSSGMSSSKATSPASPSSTKSKFDKFVKTVNFKFKKATRKDKKHDADFADDELTEDPYPEIHVGKKSLKFKKPYTRGRNDPLPTSPNQSVSPPSSDQHVSKLPPPATPPPEHPPAMYKPSPNHNDYNADQNDEDSDLSDYEQMEDLNVPSPSGSASTRPLPRRPQMIIPTAAISRSESPTEAQLKLHPQQSVQPIVGKVAPMPAQRNAMETPTTEFPVNLKSLSTRQVAETLRKLKIPEEIVDNFQEAQIDGEIFVCLTSEILDQLEVRPLHQLKIMKFKNGWRPTDK